MKKRRSPHLLAAFGVLLGVCGVFVLKRSPNATITLGGTEPRAETGSLMQQGTGLGSADTSDGKVKETMGGHRDKAAPSTEPVLASKTDDSAKKAALSPSEQSRTLSHYSMIKEKVFLSDE